MPHSRRKSGHGLPNTSMTDLRKLAAAADAAGLTPALTSRYRRTSSSKQLAKNSTSSKPSKHSSRDAAPTWDDDTADEADRYDERESFPQFCMTCEKQFVTQDEGRLYCSEDCAEYDQTHGAAFSTQVFLSTRDTKPTYSMPSPERDIIPRASPSQPSSSYFSPSSSPTRPSPITSTNSSSAVESLRSLSLRETNPPSAGYWPFSSRSAAPSPGTSFGVPPTNVYASTYDNGYYQTGAPNYYYASGAALGAGLTLPPPRRPGSYARPQSIELVAPILSQ